MKLKKLKGCCFYLTDVTSVELSTADPYSTLVCDSCGRSLLKHNDICVIGDYHFCKQCGNYNLSLFKFLGGKHAD